MLCTISGGHYPAGIYTVLYEGEGQLEFGKGPEIVDAAPGRIRINVDSSRGGFSLQLRKTEPHEPRSQHPRHHAGIRAKRGSRTRFIRPSSNAGKA